MSSKNITGNANEVKGNNSTCRSGASQKLKKEKKEVKKCKSGLLKRKAGVLKSWKNFYVEICSNSDDISVMNILEANGNSKGKFIETVQLTQASITTPHAALPSSTIFFTLSIGDKDTVFQCLGKEREDWYESFESHEVLVRRVKKEGILTKTGSLQLRWLDRYYVLYFDCLMYFKDASQIAPLGSISLNIGAILTKEKIQPINKRYLFNLSPTGDEGERAYLQGSESEVEMIEWYNAVLETIKSFDDKKDSSSIKEGYLFKTGQSDKTWHKRYFQLYPDRLLYLQRRNDPLKSAGAIELPPGFVVKQGLAPERNTIPNQFYVARNDDEKGVRRFYLACETAQELESWINALSLIDTGENINVRDDSIKEGFINKRGNVNKHWTVRYLVLTKDKLYYYKQKSDYQCGIDAAGEINIDGGAVIDRPGVEINKNNAFYVSEDGVENARKFYFYTDTLSDMNKWLDALKQVRAEKPRYVCSDSLLESYCWKVDSTFKKWAKRYFILTPTTLKYYRKRSDYSMNIAPAGVVEMPGGSEINDFHLEQKKPLELEGKTPFMFYIARNQDEETRKFVFASLCAEERDIWKSKLIELVGKKSSTIDINSIREGYLDVWTSGHTWARRYFVLKFDKLFFYQRKDDACDTSVHGNCIEIMGSSVISRIQKKDVIGCFTIAENGDQHANCFTLKAPSEEVLDDWYNVLSKIAKSKEFHVHHSSLFEGYMQLRIESKLSNSVVWLKRFVILTRDQFSVYSKMHDFNHGIPGDSIKLNSAKIKIENEMDGRRLVLSLEDQSGAKSYFSSMSDEDFHTCVDSISLLITARSAYVNPDSFVEGPFQYFYDETNTEVPSPIRRGFEINWTKGYGILLAGKLQLWKSIEEAGDKDITECSDTIVLTPEHTIDMSKNGGDRKYVFSLYVDGIENAGRYWISLDDCGDEMKSDMMACEEWYDTISTIMNTIKGYVNPHALIEGELKLYSNTKKNVVHTYYAILLPDILLCYKRKDDFLQSYSPTEKIPIVPSGIVILSEDDSYQLTIADNGDEDTEGRIIETVSEELRIQWFRTIRKLFASKERNQHPDSVKEGYLKITYPRARLSNNIRYCIIVNNCLDIFQKRSHSRPILKIFLNVDSNILSHGADGDANDNVFRVISEVRGGTDLETITFIAKNGVEKSEWLDSLNTVVQWARESKIVETKHSSKIFGGTIDDAFRRSNHVPEFPDPIAFCCSFLLKHSGDEFKLFDTAADQMTSKQIIHKLETGSQDIIIENSATAVKVLLTYLLSLEEPLIPHHMYDSIISMIPKSFMIVSPKRRDIASLAEMLRTIPTNSRLVLNYLVKFVKYYVNKFSWNEVSALAVQLAPAVLRKDATDLTASNMVIQTISCPGSGSCRVRGYTQQRPTTRTFGNEWITTPVEYLVYLLVNLYESFFNNVPRIYKKLTPDEMKVYRAKPIYKTTLNDMFNDTFGTDCYVRFAEDSFTDENIKFCLDLKKYKKLYETFALLYKDHGPDNDDNEDEDDEEEEFEVFTMESLKEHVRKGSFFVHSNSNVIPLSTQGNVRDAFDAVKSFGDKLCQEYIADAGGRCLNVSHKQRHTFLKDFESKKNSKDYSTVDGKEFDQFSRVVEQLMETNSFKRFTTDPNEHYDRWLTKLVRQREEKDDDELI